MMQKLKNVQYYKSLEGINEENCCILIKYKKSKLKGMKPAKNKTLSLEWITKFLGANT